MARVGGRHILGINLSHNSSCAIMRDGVVAYVGQEERFNRIKNVETFPQLALEHGLNTLGLKGEELDAACFTTINVDPVFTKANTVRNFSMADYINYYGTKYWEKKLSGADCIDYLQWLRDAPQFNRHETWFTYDFLESASDLGDVELMAELFRDEQITYLQRTLGISRDKVSFVRHHEAHANYGYFASPFRGSDCAVLVLDGMGDNENQTVWVASDDTLTKIASSDENDIGRVYKLATLILGMRPDEHEYKVMGLAPYAKPSHVAASFEPLSSLSRVKNMAIRHDKRPINLYKYLVEAWQGHRFDNIAGAVQRYTEDLAVELVRDVHNTTGLRRFALSGGISLNVKMNQRIAELPFVDELFVAGSGGDESLSIGGCYALNGGGAPLQSLYLGFDAQEDTQSEVWKSLADEFEITLGFSPHDVAALLADGEIVARVHGRAEFGARALGGRSILADPSNIDNVRQINEAVKQRDFWMPFALSILDEFAGLYINNPKKISAPHMTIAFDTVPSNYERICAGTHPYDRTVRPQIVSRDTAPSYYAVIEEFHKLSGVPALLNTSFNLHGDPIVNNLSDAVHTLRNSGLQYLVFEDRLIAKK